LVCFSYRQGDPLSPLLFNIATSDAIKAIESDSRRTKIYAYADDMVIVSTSIRELQESFDDLAEWEEDNSLQMNVGKTEMMVFRKGGKVRREDKIAYDRDYLKVVNSYKYLGITLLPSGTAFTMHIKEKTLLAIRAMADIQSLSKLSLKTAMKLFDLKIVPILTYGLTTIWEYLRCKQP
jgi:hypothetical protein